jgi:hypothetical protein
MTTQELIRAAILGLLVGAVLFVFGVLIARQARAEGDDSRWIYRTIRQQYVAYDHWTGHYVHRYRYVRQRIRNHAYYLPEREPTRVYGYARRDDDPDERMQCLQKSRRVDVLSTEHQTEESAREAAKKLWMAKTQWEIGGQYMNLDEASEVRWRCGPSNAHDTVSGRLAEAAGTLTGKGGQNVRCALSATPCKGPRESDRGRR